MKTIIKMAAVAALGFHVASCEKEPVAADTGEFHIEMDYIWAMSNAPFSLGTDLFHPMTQDTLNFSTFKHYISNVKLHSLDGSVWEDVESYYLVDLSDPTSLDLYFNNVPVGEYDRIEFTLGVDSLRNVSGVQSGALDPANQMFWSWNSGYIMIKAEGVFQGGESFAYHLGGFSGEHNTVMTKTLEFPNGAMMTISPDAAPVVHALANPAKLFHTQGTVENAPMVHMPGETAGIMAQDFNSAIYIDHLHN